MKAEPETDDAVDRLWKAGSDITGATAGGVLGLVLGGPPGAVAGAAAGAAFSSAFKEVAHRVLSRREQARIGAVFQYADTAYQKNLAAGQKLRDDCFFKADKKGRVPADEAIEGVLVTAQRQHEERKIEYIGYLLANVAFAPMLDHSLINWTIKLADELTWTQLVLLAIVGDDDSAHGRPDIEVGRGAESWSAFGVQRQLRNLGYGERGLIWAESNETPQYGFKTPNMSFRDQQLDNAARLLHDLMWLDRIPASDRSVVLAALVSKDPNSAERDDQK